MSFCVALALVKSLEGVGKTGERYGMTQATWELLGFKGNVERASDAQIANAYRLLWDHARLYLDGQSVGLFDSTPEPADAVAFQFFINVPVAEFVKAFQGAIGAKMDGVLGPLTLRALQSWNGRGMDLSEAILTAQHWHYQCGNSPDKIGLLNRVEKVKEWLARQ